MRDRSPCSIAWDSRSRIFPRFDTFTESSTGPTFTNPSTFLPTPTILAICSACCCGPLETSGLHNVLHEMPAALLPSLEAVAGLSTVVRGTRATGTDKRPVDQRRGPLRRVDAQQIGATGRHGRQHSIGFDHDHGRETDAGRDHVTPMTA